MVAKLVSLRDINLRNSSGIIRKIADKIDAGKYGNVDCVAVVILGDTLEVFAAGPNSSGQSTIALLQAGSMRLAGALERHGKE